MSLTTMSQQVRAITDAEAIFFQRNGWLHLKGLLNDDTAELLRRSLTQLTGDNGLIAHHPANHSMNGWAFNVFGPLAVDSGTGAPKNDVFYSFIHQLGTLGQKLAGVPVRFALDQSLVKSPNGAVGGNNDHVYWHQDNPGTNSSPFNSRDAQVKVWIALCDIPPEMGSMRFVAEEKVTPDVERILRDKKKFPDCLTELEQMGVVSPALNLRCGDATVHRASTWHASLRNQTSNIRWAYAVSMFAAHAKYSGHPWWVLNDIPSIKKGDAFPDSRFPILAGDTLP